MRDISHFLSAMLTKKQPRITYEPWMKLTLTYTELKTQWFYTLAYKD